MKKMYAKALYHDDRATLDDLREAVTTLEDTVRVSRRVLGQAHPTVEGVENALEDSRAKLRAREKQASSGAVSLAMCSAD